MQLKRAVDRTLAGTALGVATILPTRPGDRRRGFVAAFLAIAIGVASNLGTGPIELVMLGLHDKGMGMQTARWLIEGLMLLAGILLGGDFGVITVVGHLASILSSSRLR